MTGHGLDSSGSEEGQILGSCEYGNDPYGSIKCREFFEKLGTKFLKKYPASCS